MAATYEIDREVASQLLDETVEPPAELSGLDKIVNLAIDSEAARKLSGGKPRSIEPRTGLVLDDRPELVPERTGLEELDVEEIYRHRYSGQYHGEPKSHFLGGSSDITFGGSDGEETELEGEENDEVGTFFDEGVSPSWERLRRFATSREERHWRDAYHQIGFIADRLDLPNHIREDITRAYANLRKKGKVQESRRSLEEVLSLLTYMACRIHKYSRGFEGIEKVIDELYGIEIERDDVTRDIARAFNKGPIRFGINNRNGYQYLHTWKRINGKKVDHRSLGPL